VPNHYERLGVRPDASPAELRRAYRRLVLEHHPDRAEPPRRQEAQATTSALTTAYRVLADPAARRRYDIEAGIPRQGAQGVRRADRPWPGDPRPTRLHDHDPVLRRVPERGTARRDRPPVDATPRGATLPRLALAAVAVVAGVVLLVAGAATGATALGVVGGLAAAAGVVGALLVELSRKDGI
jgi:hypothetical protein